MSIKSNFSIEKNPLFQMSVNKWRSMLRTFTCPLLPVVLCAIMFHSSCASPGYSVPPQYSSYSTPLKMETETGIASWYGSDFHGRTTSSGETYNMHELTAAHKTLPFGCHVRVTNLENKRSVEVRINDRGPFIKNRIIDLSYAGAKALDIADKGIAMVQVEVIKEAKYHNAQYTLQVGSFKEEINALQLRRELDKKYKDVYIVVWDAPSDTYYRVRIGYFNTNEEASKTAQKLTNDGLTVFHTTRN